MHILILPSWYYDIHGKGGGIFFKEQAQALARWGEVKVGLLYGQFDWHQPLRPVERADQQDGFLTVRANAFALPKVTQWGLRFWMWRYDQLLGSYLKKAGLPDLIHAHSWVGGLAAKHLKSKYKIPYLVTEHLSAFLNETITSRQKKWCQLAFDQAAAVIAVSEGLKTSIAHYTDNGNVSVLPNMVDTAFFTISSTDYYSDTLRLLSIGDPWFTKGLDLLIEAVGIASQKVSWKIELLLGDEIPNRSTLQELASSYGIRDRVQFIGRLSRMEVRKAMQSTDIYVSASRLETFGVTMVEALSCGKPVIATRTAGASDIFREAPEFGQMVPVGDVQALARAIVNIGSQKHVYDGEALRAHAIQHFSQAAIVPKLINRYKSVLQL